MDQTQSVHDLLLGGAPVRLSYDQPYLYSWTSPAGGGWTFNDGSGAGVGSVASVTTRSREAGGYSLRVTGPAAPVAGLQSYSGVAQNAGDYHTFMVLPAGRYTLSGWISIETLSDGGIQPLVIAIGSDPDLAVVLPEPDSDSGNVYVTHGQAVTTVDPFFHYASVDLDLSGPAYVGLFFTTPFSHALTPSHRFYLDDVRVDRWEDTGPVTITRGRFTHDERYAPATMTAAIAGADLARLPAEGDRVNVELTPAAMATLGMAADDDARVRFRGYLTDASGQDESRLAGAARLQLVAVGPRALLGGAMVGGGAWPLEGASNRAERILAEAVASDARLDVAPGGGIGGYYVLARAAGLTDAAGLLDSLSEDVGGELYERRDGKLLWLDRDWHGADIASLTLAAGEIVAPARYVLQLTGKVNDLTLGYGGAGATVNAQEPDSITLYGRVASSRDTQLVGNPAGTNPSGSESALNRAQVIVAQRAYSEWRVEQLTVDLERTVTPAKAKALLRSDYGNLVNLDLTGIAAPAVGPWSDTRVFVEGSVEEYSRTSWQLHLAVIRYRQVVNGLTWNKVPAGLAWQDVATDVLWQGATAWDPVENNYP